MPAGSSNSWTTPSTTASVSGSARRFGRIPCRPQGPALPNAAAFGKGMGRRSRKPGRRTRRSGETSVKGSTNLPWRPPVLRRGAGVSASGPAAKILFATARAGKRGGNSGHGRRIWRSDTQIHPVLSRGCGRWHRLWRFLRRPGGAQRTLKVYFAILWLSTGKPTICGGAPFSPVSLPIWDRLLRVTVAADYL